MIRPHATVMDSALAYFESLSTSPSESSAELPEEREKAALGKGAAYGAGFYGGGGGTTYHKGLPAYLGGQGPGGWASNHFAESQNVVGWAFCATRAIARACAKAERKVFSTGDSARKRIDKATKEYKRGRLDGVVYREYMKSITSSSDGDDAVPVGSNNPLLKIVNRPNPYMSPAQFLFQFAQQICVTGTALLWTRRNGYTEFDRRGTPVYAYIIPTGIAAPLPPSGHKSKYGAYMIMPIGSYGGAVTDDDGFADAAWSNLMLTGGVVDGAQIRPVRWPHPLFLTDGLSTMAAGELWVDVANQLDRATWYGFRNSLRPGFIFGMDPNAEDPSEEESKRLDMQLSTQVSGIHNVGKHVRLPKGVGILEHDRGVAELDYANGRQVIGRDVLALWATPPVACGIQDSGAYAAYFASLLQFTEQAVSPVLDLISDDVTHEWARAFGGDLEVKYTPAPINDAQQKLQELSMDVQAKSITFNEYRKKMGYEPWPEPFGSVQVGKDIPSPWEMDQINTDMAGQQMDLENQAAGQADSQVPNSGQNDLDTETPTEQNGPVKQPDAGAAPPRSTGGAAGRQPSGFAKSLRRSLKEQRDRSVKRFKEVPGFFPRMPVRIPTGVISGSAVYR